MRNATQPSSRTRWSCGPPPASSPCVLRLPVIQGHLPQIHLNQENMVDKREADDEFFLFLADNESWFFKEQPHGQGAEHWTNKLIFSGSRPGIEVIRGALNINLFHVESYWVRDSTTESCAADSIRRIQWSPRSARKIAFPSTFNEKKSTSRSISESRALYL